MAQNVFDLLKREKKYEISNRKKFQSFYFKIRNNPQGSYLTVVDSNYEEINVNFRDYQGPQRVILQAMENYSSKNAFTISWDSNTNYFYLHEHEHLIEHLLDCTNVITLENKKVGFAAKLLEYRLLVSEAEAKITTKVIAKTDDEEFPSFMAISPQYAIVDSIIYKTTDLGDQFIYIQYFTSTFSNKEFNHFLTLFFSCFNNVEIDYNNYQVEHRNENIETTCALLFEKIDVDNSLYIRVNQVLPEFDVNFYENYTPVKYAIANRIENRIMVQKITATDTSKHLEEIFNQIKKHKKLSKGVCEILEEDNVIILSKEIASSFIYKDLPSLMQKYEVYGIEKLKDYKIVAIKPKVNFNISSGIDFLEGDVTLDFGSETLNLFDVISQYRKQRYIKLSDGNHAVLNEKYIKQLERAFKVKKGKTEISFYDLPIIEDLIENKENQAFKRNREIFMGLNNLQKSKEKLPYINAQLREYQKYGVKWLQYLNKNKLGGCLADDMGLGKTIQAITLLSGFYPGQKNPSLIVMPKSLLFNWENEFQKFCPTIKTATYYGSDRNLAEALKAEVILTTYAMVRIDIEQFKEINFFYIILDESQNIKNLNAQVSKAVVLLQSEHKLALSGTPIENNLGELYSLFRYLNPGMFGTQQHFNEFYATPVQKNGDEDASLALKKKIYPFILRRLKSDVLKELPPKTEQVVFVDMSDEQRKFYEERRLFYQQAITDKVTKYGIANSQFFIFQALSELRQIASIPESKSENTIASSKIEQMMDYLLPAIEGGHKVLLFTNFLAVVEQVGLKLSEEGIEFASITGATSNRQAEVNKFQNTKSCKVFVATLKTGGTGLNLTAADLVFIFDPWWNKSAENQAIDRAHRIGQKKNILIYKLIAKNSIEEKIQQLQEKKSELFDSIISADSSFVKSLSEKDIEFILS